MDHLFIPGFTHQQSEVQLDDASRRHVAALRLRDGEPIRVLNGKGLVGDCSVLRRNGTLHLTVVAREERPRPPLLTLVMSNLDSRDRFEFALEKATELGATHFLPLLADRSQHQRVSADRLRAKAIAAITQCGVAWLPEIMEPCTIDGVQWGDAVIVGDDRGSRPTSADVAVTSITVVVGPEGDFSDREKAALATLPQARTWAIGSTRLRAETAAIALVSAVVALR